jgi:hypothetical protein
MSSQPHQRPLVQPRRCPGDCDVPVAHAFHRQLPDGLREQDPAAAQSRRVQPPARRGRAAREPRRAHRAALRPTETRTTTRLSVPRSARSPSNARCARTALRTPRASRRAPPLPRSQWPVTAAHCHNKPLRTDHGRSRGVSVNMAPKEGGGFSADNRRQVRLALHQTPPPRAYIARAICVFIPNNTQLDRALPHRSFTTAVLGLRLWFCWT